jgi:ferrous iron transport protein A
MKGGTMMPITMADNGDTIRIRKITGPDAVRQRLAELGFVADGEVTVVNKIGGNLIVQVKESRIALDKSMATRIMF